MLAPGMGLDKTAQVEVGMPELSQGGASRCVRRVPARPVMFLIGRAWPRCLRHRSGVLLISNFAHGL